MTVEIPAGKVSQGAYTVERGALQNKSMGERNRVKEVGQRKKREKRET